MKKHLCLGVNVYPAKGDAAIRQEKGNQSILALSGVERVNVQFHDRGDLEERDGLETLCVLRRDSRTVSRQKGARKPVVSEIFAVLAQEGLSRNCRYFGFANSDIEISQRAIDVACEQERDCFLFSRMDIDPQSGEELGMGIWGIDFVVINCQWFLDHRRLFRPYILGEMCWDNTYAAILLCHSRGLLLNDEPLIRHERHEFNWTQGPFAEFNGYLAALDAPYFSVWCHYIHHLETLRARRAGLDREIELQRHIFRYRPKPWHRMKHVGRKLLAHWRYHRKSAGIQCAS